MQFIKAHAWHLKLHHGVSLFAFLVGGSRNVQKTNL